MSATITVDLGAIRHNVRRLRELTGVPLMAVVKADAYGHGMVEVARAAREAGAVWLGVATPAEALALREAGDTGPLLCWLTVPSDDLAALVAADVEITVYSRAELRVVVKAGEQAHRRARVQLKVDTGLSRGGASLDEWAELCRASAEYEAVGALEVTGLWTHPISADEPDAAVNDLQEERFRAALSTAREAGLTTELVHMASSGLALGRPSTRFAMTRCGIALYGLNPGLSSELWETFDLRPAMTVTTELALVKRVKAGESVSYGATWTAERDTTVGLVPVGYADGVPRSASNAAELWWGGERRPLRGRVCMDQFLIDLGDDTAAAGDVVTLFGPGGEGEPTAEEWGRAAGTINYEIVTRLGGRFQREWVG